jgi:hypothetical protein
VFVLIEVFVILGVVFGIINAFSTWVVVNHPGWRNPVSFVLALVSAYSASFVLDMIIQATFYKTLPLQNIMWPVLTWSLIGAVVYVIAVQTSANSLAVALGFSIVAIVASLAAFVHIANLAVGLPLLLIAMATLAFYSKSREVQ